jgi:hypothetical protein
MPVRSPGRIHDQQPALAVTQERAHILEGVIELIRAERLREIGIRAARQRRQRVVLAREDLHRRVPRQRILLQLAEHGPTEHVG